MKVHVEFHDDAHTKARIMIVPGWLGRLFGAKTRTGEAERTHDNAYGLRWKFVATGREVPIEAIEALELQEVSPLPRATTQTPRRPFVRPRCECPAKHPVDEAFVFDGVGTREYHCRNCGRLTDKPTEAA